MKKAKFKEYDCVVKKGRYTNGNLALVLLDEEDNSPVATITVNTGEILPPDQAYVKDYSENQGILEFIKEIGLVKEILGYTRLGWVESVPLVNFDLKDVEEL